MSLNFAIVGFYPLFYAVLGSIVLAVVPGLRVTLLNLVTFVVGAWLGGMAFLVAYVNISSARFDRYPDAVSLFGAIACGTALVWLKLRFVQRQNDSRIL
jgi:hypothetical protein